MSIERCERGGKISIPMEYKKIFSISELTSSIKDLLETSFPEVWVEGEISNLRIPSSGHYYFTLKDERSQLRAVLFRSSGRNLTCELRDGMLVICRGRISLYEPRGDYQLLIDYLEPKGIGALQLAFEQLKEKLSAEGLFDPGRKRPIPMLPRTIGIVTSPTGAAIRDLLKVIGRRFPTMSILIDPVRVQGEGSALEIARAINRLGVMSGVDVIIVARGGGSLEDLWAFNEEIVARAIYDSAVPVISAVGHEIDFTIADFVADLRAPTPSAAGELVVPEKAGLLNRIHLLSDRLCKRMGHRFEMEKQQVQFLSRRMPDMRLRLGGLHLRVDDMKIRLAPQVLQLVRLRGEAWKSCRARLTVRSPRIAIEHYGKGLLLTRKLLVDNTRRLLSRRRQIVQGYGEGLNRLSPLNVLKRGYSITHRLPSYRIVKESSELARGDRVSVRLCRGTIVCSVDDVDE